MPIDPSSKIAPQGAGQTEKTLDAKSNARLQKAAKEFEAIFLGYMLKSMRASIPKSDMFGDSFGGDVLEQMFDMEMSKQLSKTSHLGIGEMVAKGVAAKASQIPQQSPAPVQNAPAQKAPASPPATAEKPVEKKDAALPPWIGNKSPLRTKLPASVAPADTLPVRASQDTLRRVNAYDAMIKEAADTVGVSPHLVKAVITAESAGQAQARSSKNAKGLMQLIDSTASAMGVKNVWNPRENIMGGAKYLQEQMERFDGDVEKAVAAYNAGPGAVEKHDGIPPFNETKQYVQKVMGYLRYFETQEATGDDDEQ